MTAFFGYQNLQAACTLRPAGSLINIPKSCSAVDAQSVLDAVSTNMGVSKDFLSAEIFRDIYYGTINEVKVSITVLSDILSYDSNPTFACQIDGYVSFVNGVDMGSNTCMISFSKSDTTLTEKKLDSKNGDRMLLVRYEKKYAEGYTSQLHSITNTFGTCNEYNSNGQLIGPRTVAVKQTNSFNILGTDLEPLYFQFPFKNNFNCSLSYSFSGGRCDSASPTITGEEPCYSLYNDRTAY